MHYQAPVVPFYLRIAATTYVSHDDVVTLSRKIEDMFHQLGLLEGSEASRSPCIEWECIYHGCTVNIHIFQSSTDSTQRLVEMRCLDGTRYWWNVSYILSRFFVPPNTTHRII